MMTLKVYLVELVEVISAEVVVGLLAGEQVVPAHQQGVRDGNERAVPSPTTGEAAELRAEVGGGLTRVGPGYLNC
jgi:hypothetical protein